MAYLQVVLMYVICINLELTTYIDVSLKELDLRSNTIRLDDVVQQM